MKGHDKNIRKGTAAFLAATLACALGAASARIAMPARGADENPQTLGAILLEELLLDTILEQMLRDQKYAAEFYTDYDHENEDHRFARDYFLRRLEERLGKEPQNEQLKGLQRRLLDPHRTALRLALFGETIRTVE